MDKSTRNKLTKLVSDRGKLAKLVAEEAVSCGLWSPDKGAFFIEVASDKAIQEYIVELEIELRLGQSIQRWLVEN